MFTSTFAVGPQPWALDPGALRPLIDSYIADLASRGYEAATIHHLEHSARHFCFWLNHSGIAVSQTDDHVIKRFAEHRCNCPGYRASEILSTAFAGMVRKFVGFLRNPESSSALRLQLVMALSRHIWIGCGSTEAYPSTPLPRAVS